jgi:benzoyl-CoA reductase subunit C
LSEYEEIIDKRHDYARRWKAETGGKVVGYFCTYVPEELLHAAGILPIRILGSHEAQDVTEPHVYSMFCPFSRDCLAQGLLGRYDYLDGIVIGHSCLHAHQAFWIWEANVPTDYHYYLTMPVKVWGPSAKSFLLEELGSFKSSLEQWTGKQITEETLDQSIEVYNANRRLLRGIYELRRADRPPLLGSQAVEMVLSSMMMDKAAHNRLLQGTLQNLKKDGGGEEPGVRLMHIGSVCDDIDLFKLTESLGATFVIDDQCSGSRYFWNEVVPESDRLAAIAARYLNRPPCPQKDSELRLRREHILKLVHDYNVQGVFLIQQKFCDPHELDIPTLRQLLKDNNIPSLFLELDITNPTGQFRTRIEAFLETLSLGIA